MRAQATVAQRPFRDVRREPEPDRAAYPDEEGFIERDGVRVFWERYGEGEPTIVLVATWGIVHSRAWRAQIPYLARHHRVLAIDPRGNGRSDRPSDPAAHAEAELARDTIAVMDATGTDRAILVGLSLGCQRTLIATAEYPERVLATVLISPQLDVFDERYAAFFKGRLDSYEGWDRFNPEYVRGDHHGFLEWWFGLVFPEPHSTRQIESAIQYGLDTDPETLIASLVGPKLTREDAYGLAERLCCPVLVIAGKHELVVPVPPIHRLAELCGAELVTLPRAGHAPHARYPVEVNLMLRDFACRVAAGELESAAQRSG